MNITFSWNRDGDRCTPVSRSHLQNQDGVSLLDCILMDDGGIPVSDTIPWLDQGLMRIDSVAIRESESTHWDREAWGVEFRNNTAKIYSLHDPEYFQILKLDAFSALLREWTAFLRAGPGDTATKQVNLLIEELTSEGS